MTDRLEFDIWSSNDGSITAKEAGLKFIDGADAPYGYYNHEVRVQADSARLALREYREMRKG